MSDASAPSAPGPELRWRNALACALIFAVTITAYLPALRSGFVWNDTDYVTRLELQSRAGLARIWFEPGATEQYYPVLHTAFWIEHRLWGDAAPGYHLLNVLLHATAACLFGLVVQRLFRDRNRASPIIGGLAALLFALHPVGVESVAWISEQKNTLSTVFYLAAALAYLRFDEERSRRAYVVAGAFFLLAVLSKSVTASLPAAALVVLWWRRGRLSWSRDVRPLLPAFVIGAATGLFTAWVERSLIGAEGAEFALTPGQRWLLAGRIPWFYLGKLLWPHPLVFIYPRWKVDPAVLAQHVFPIAALAALLALWSWSRRRQTRGPLAVALLFAGTLFPVLGFFNVYAFLFSFVADHLQYLAGLAVFAGAAALLGPLLARGPRTAGIVGVAALAGLLGVLTWRQCAGYRDLDTFYRTILARNPGSWLAHYNLGNLLRESGRTDDAIAEYTAAADTRPGGYPEAENNLGLALAAGNRTREAITHYERAIQLRPRYAAAHSNLGNALRAEGRTADAILHYEEALHLRPDYAEADYNLGLTLLAARRAPEAAPRLEAAVRLQPGFPEALNSLGNSLAATGRLSEAVGRYEEALRARPNYPDALNNLGNTLHVLGRNDQAIACYERALQLQPDLAAARNNLGIALAGAGRLPEATAQFEQAIRLRPDFAEAHNNLGIVLATAGRLDEAIAHYQQALRLQPDYADARRNLALAQQQSVRERK
ncbi:MAG TPA: tetratricopeptide repeat protein [Opitutaceae bacterium]|nr:tetratricopeptide repeat protein [Opitutaceae bacterium]